MDKRNFSGLNSAEITASVTAAANLLAAKLSDDELNLLSSVFMQFADTLATIYVVRIINSTAETDGTAPKKSDKENSVTPEAESSPRCSSSSAEAENTEKQ